MMRRMWVSAIVIVLIASLIPIIIEIAPTVISADTWYVDDVPGGNPPEDFTSIQAAVDFAQPGDTVFVYAGFYDEDVIIEKTINLTGEDRDTTIINGSGGGGSIWARYADYINVSGFTLQNGGTGISLYYSNFSKVENCKAVFNKYGIIVSNSNSTVVENNIASNNSNYYGIYLSKSNNNIIRNNTCYDNFAAGIKITDNSNNNIITNNNCSYNNYGIYLSLSSNNNQVSNNQVLFNDISAIDSTGIAISSADNNTLFNNTISGNKYGIAISSTFPVINYVINSTIENSIEKEIVMGSKSRGLLLNTTFNKDRTYHVDSTSIIEVRWYLHINVINHLGNSVPNAKVKIEDNRNGSYVETFVTDGNGDVKWVPVTEYIEQDTNGDNVGEKTYFTPHRIIAWNDTLVGYAYPDPIVDESKKINIVLYNGTLMDLEPEWNLISLPRIPSNADIGIILQSIEGRFDTVQWFNITDNNDHWKHYHVSKPSNMNDLDVLNHTIGFWIYIIDPYGTILVVFGDELISDQNITIYPGWNHVGYPSKSNKTRDVALDNLFYGSDVDSIWAYNATIQKWIELDESTDYFEVGQGYWMHSKVMKVWNVPL